MLSKIKGFIMEDISEGAAIQSIEKMKIQIKNRPKYFSCINSAI